MTANIGTALVGRFDFSDNGANIWNPANTFQYTIQAAAIAAGRVLNLPLVTADDTFAVLGLAQTWTAAQTIEANLITRLVRPQTSVTYDLGSNAFKYNYAYVNRGIQIGVNQWAYQVANTSGSGEYFNNAVGNKGFDKTISSVVIYKVWAATDQGAVFQTPITADPPNATAQGNFYIWDDGASASWFRLASNGQFMNVEQRQEVSVTPSATITLTHNAFTNVYATWTAGQNETVNASGTQLAGQRMDLLIECDTTSRTITFGTGFRPNGTAVLTLSTGATFYFVSNGSHWCEVARTIGI